MAKKKTGLGIDALFPQKEDEEPQAADQEQNEGARSRPRRAKRATTSKRQARNRKANVSRDERIKTSVELLPETLELIDQIKAQHRREHRRLLPMWKILDEAVRELARQWLE